MTRSILLLLMCIFPLSACSTTPPEPKPLSLRVLSYNIHHGRGADGRIDLERLAKVIAQSQPDLVALQEVDRETKRSGGLDQAARLGELTKTHHYFAEAMPFSGGGYGEAVLSKVPIQYSFNHSLPYEKGQEPRSAAKINVKPWGEDGQLVLFAGTHLCHQSNETRVKQVGAITAGKGYIGSPAVLAGDFNFTPDSEPYKNLIDAGWVDTAASFGDPKPTYPADKPRIRIDYVFVRPAKRWRVIDVKVIDEPVASDHAPVLVELEYIPPAKN